MASLLALRRAIRAVVNPEAEGDASTRLAFMADGEESDASTVRWLAILVGPVHVLAIIVFLRLFLHETDPSLAAWQSWGSVINGGMLASALLGALVVLRGRPAALSRAIGDVVGAVYLLGGAAMSANAQRANPNVNVFVMVSFFIAVRMRMRPKVYALSLLAGASLVFASMLRFRAGGQGRIADALIALGAGVLSLIVFLRSRSMRFRELDARRKVEELNAELESRVEAQVGKIVAHAREIEELNARLNEKIRERSRELSMALARLAEGHGELKPGTVLGERVALSLPLGRGGMGIVYRGRDLLTNNAVAVKVIQAGSAGELDGLQRFLREAEALASVNHRAIVRSIHVDISEDGQLFQIMELVEGETLGACLARKGPLSPLVAARLGAVLADALATAHAARLVHRDVKPANVLLTREAPGLKLLDFGISKLWDGRGDSGGTEGRILGTPEFMSPEQVNDPASVGDRADVYALGLLLYLAIAGRLPFDAPDQRTWLIAHAARAPLDLKEIAPEVDPELAALVMACLRKDPRERPTASEMATMLSVLADAAGVPPLEALDLTARGDTTRELSQTQAAPSDHHDSAAMTQMALPRQET